MKKAIFIFSIFAIAFMPVMVGATVPVGGDSHLLTAGLTKGEGGIEAPVIKAKWEMKKHILFRDGLVVNMAEMAQDDSVADHTQIMPSGIYGDNVPYTICAIVTDQGIDNTNISSVAAREIHYPEGVAFHAHPTLMDKVDGGPDLGAITPQGVASPGFDLGESGCGVDMLGSDEIGFTRLTKDDGYDLFCNKVKNENYNLPWFYEMPTGGLYDYNEICAPDGELMENHAFVYCGISDLYYEDPAGDYRIVVKAQVVDGKTDVEENFLTYLAMESFAVDFENGINYGTVVSTNQWYGAGDGVIDSGDIDFGTIRPTLRNLGNVRLYIGVEQDDMGFGTTGGVPNIKYRARIGNEDLNWWYYDPNMGGDVAWMEDILDLSEDEKIDFNVMVSQWPSQDESWSGDMVLSSMQAEFRKCALDPR